jgi:hypothetical protein
LKSGRILGASPWSIRITGLGLRDALDSNGRTHAAEIRRMVTAAYMTPARAAPATPGLWRPTWGIAISRIRPATRRWRRGGLRIFGGIKAARTQCVLGVGFLTAKIAQERARRELKNNYYWLAYCGGLIVYILRFGWALPLVLAIALLPSILLAEPAPVNAPSRHLHTTRHTGHILCRYTGQRCSTGCGSYADKGVCAEYVCDHRSWNFSGFCLRSVCSPKSC